MEYKNQLKSILYASGWSQEKLAYALNVSFATLNSWVNERSIPRSRSVQEIEKLYFQVVGIDDVDENVLKDTKCNAIRLQTTAKKIINNKNILDKLTLYLTYHTNTIEGSTMTLLDVNDVIFKHKVLANRTLIEQVEAQNHQSALYWLLDQIVDRANNFVIDEDLILGIHLRLMNDIIGDAGQYRRHSVRIMGSHVPLSNWVKVPDLIRELVHDLINPTEDIIELLAKTHARFEQIHPFSDGNGRTGRLIMLAEALYAGLMPPLVVKERKFAYYKYLELAQTKDNYKPLELFIAESIKFTDNLLKTK